MILLFRITIREEALVFFSSLRIVSDITVELYEDDFCQGSGFLLGILLEENLSASSLDGVIGPFLIFKAKALNIKW